MVMFLGNLEISNSLPTQYLILKEAMVVLVLKKPSYDAVDMANYCPVLTLLFVGKVIEEEQLSNSKNS